MTANAIITNLAPYIAMAIIGGGMYLMWLKAKRHDDNQKDGD
jgi:hypothetical protein